MKIVTINPNTWLIVSLSQNFNQRDLRNISQNSNKNDKKKKKKKKKKKICRLMIMTHLKMVAK